MSGAFLPLPQSAPYTAPLKVLICGGTTSSGKALDNCVSIEPEAANSTLDSLISFFRLIDSIVPWVRWRSIPSFVISFMAVKTDWLIMSSNILQFNGSHADGLGHADDKWAVLCEVRIVPDVGL